MEVWRLEAKPAIPPRNNGLVCFFYKLQPLAKHVKALSLPEQERVAEVFAYYYDEITQSLEKTAAAGALPSDTTFEVPRKAWRAPLTQKKSHSPVGARLMTQAEAAEREVDARIAEQRREERETAIDPAEAPAEAQNVEEVLDVPEVLLTRW